MRTGLKILLVVVILGVLAYGLLGPVVVKGHLQDEANTAAKAGYNQLISASSSTKSVQSVVTSSVAHQANVRVKSVEITNGQVTVVLEEKVHSFMSGFPGLKGWFTVTAAESASALG